MDEIDSYIANFITLDNSSLTAVSEQERVRVNVRPSIGPEVGQFLGLLIRLIQAKRVLEFGTTWVTQPYGLVRPCEPQAAG